MSRISDGLILCDFLSSSVPGIDFRGLHAKPRTRKTAVDNLESGLAEVWKRRGYGISARIICTSLEIYEAHKNSKKVERFFQGLFETFVLREIRPHARYVISYFNSYLALFGWEFSEEAKNSPCDFNGSLPSEFSSLVRIGLVLCLLGKVTISDLTSNLFGNPDSDDKVLSNARFILAVANEAGLPVLFSVSDFARHGDAAVAELVVLQLHAIWESLTNDVDSFQLPAPDDRESIADLLGLGKTITEDQMSNLTFRDGAQLIRDSLEGGSPSESQNRERHSVSPKQRVNQRQFVSIYGPVDMALCDTKTGRELECSLTVRYISTAKQLTVQFWPIVETENCLPFLVFDMRAMLDVLPYEDAQIKDAILLVVHAWGVMRDEMQMSNDPIMSVRVLPRKQSRMETVHSLMELMERYSGEKGPQSS